MTLRALIFLLCLLVFIEPATACPALRDEDAYGEKFKDYRLLTEGIDGWWFRSRQDFRMDYAMPDKTRVLFLQLNAMLVERGVTLAIAFPPTRAIAAADFVPPRYIVNFDPARARKNYAKFLKDMNADGMNFVGLSAITPSQFFKTDPHWTSAGARAMAQSVADRLKTLPVYRELRKISYTTREAGHATSEGAFNRALAALCNTKIPAEDETLYETAPVKISSAQDTLFADASAPEIVLIGTSNSRRSANDPNFEGFLKEYLSADIFNGAKEGSGIGDPFLDYLSSPAWRDTPPKLIVWEIPGHYDLDAGSAQNILRRLIPALAGDCPGTALAEFSMQNLSNRKTVIFDHLAPRAIAAESAYAFIRFDGTPPNEFSLTFKHADGTPSLFRFKRNRADPSQAVFTVLPVPKSPASLDSVTLRLPDNPARVRAVIRLCPLKILKNP